MLAFKHFVIRPIRENDIDNLLLLADAAGPGMTNLPKDRGLLEAKIQASLKSFAKIDGDIHDEFYFFVLEDLFTKSLVGCCGIFSDVGTQQPFYSFRVVHHVVKSKFLGIKKDLATVQLCTDYQGVTEIGSLYLMKNYRKDRLGEFLSRSRYLFMADHPKRFHETVIAEMRGRVDKTGRSPFWHALGKKFIGMRFHEVDLLTASNQKDFIAELLPSTPIHTELLDRRARACMGQPHKSTRAAVRLLEREGFEKSHYIDVFDGGPTYEAKVHDLHTVKTSHTANICDIVPDLDSPQKYIIGGGPDYRMCVGLMSVINENEVIITQSIAKRLNVKVGDTVRYVTF